MGIDEYLRRKGRGALTELHRLTGVSPPVLRKIARHEPVRLDTAARVAKVLGCSLRALTHPRPRKVAS